MADSKYRHLAFGQKVWVKLTEISTGLYAHAVSVQSGEAHIGAAGGHLATPSATFTRPSNTDAYAVGDLIANDVDAVDVVPMSFTCARIAAGSFMIRRARIRKSSTGVTAPNFRLHLYSTTPATIANGDGGAWSTTGSATYLGAIDVSTDKLFTDGVSGTGVPLAGSEISVVLTSGQIIYGLLEARGAYAPASAEVFLVTLEVVQN